jgi:RNA 2',3'-cyclic 3'-phosphodiesterase
MRLFAALELPAEARAGISEAFSRLRSLAPKVKWVPSEAMHLTLHFFGEVAEADVGGFSPVFEDASLQCPAIPFHLGQTGFFPPAGPPRVMWVGLARGVEEMRAFLEQFTARIETLRRGGGPLRQWEPDSRGFSPHITVARAGAVPLSREWAAQVKVPPAEFRVERCVLFQSILGPGGARYEPVKDIRFSGASA